MDKISVLGLALKGPVGVYDHEKGIEQSLLLDLEVSVAELTETDALSRTVDYDQVAAIAREVVGSRHHELIETIATRIADRVLALSTVLAVTVRVDKPGAVPDARTVRVEVTRVGSPTGKAV